MFSARAPPGGADGVVTGAVTGVVGEESRPQPARSRTTRATAGARRVMNEDPRTVGRLSRRAGADDGVEGRRQQVLVDGTADAGGEEGALLAELLRVGQREQAHRL